MPHFAAKPQNRCLRLFIRGKWLTGQKGAEALEKSGDQRFYIVLNYGGAGLDNCVGEKVLMTKGVQHREFSGFRQPVFHQNFFPVWFGVELFNFYYLIRKKAVRVINPGEYAAGPVLFLQSNIRKNIPFFRNICRFL